MLCTDIRNSKSFICVIATFVVALSHREGLQAVQEAAGFGQGVPAGALEVKVKAIEGDVVWVTPGPAGGAVQWNTHGPVPCDTANLLFTTTSVHTWI
uniref:Uncharacterized protein n=1 Tax=Pygocentrus nattereri TaxID=42514 RepID=A0A3B4D9C8_PYGNA